MSQPRKIPHGRQPRSDGMPSDQGTAPHATMTPVGPVAQLVRAGDSSTMVPLHRKVQSGRDEFREPLPARALLATLSQAGGTPPEGAETT